MADIEWEDIMNMMGQGAQLAGATKGIGTAGVPAAPSWSAELGTQAATELGKATAPTAAPAPTAGERLMGALTGYAPVFHGVGSILQGGKETVGGQISGLLGQVAQAQQMNEALRKLLGPILAGGGAGFQSSQMPTLGSAEVSGLTPEMVSGLYGTALQVREAERKAPLEAIKTYAAVHDVITSGTLRGAQTEQALAIAQEHLSNVQKAPLDAATKMIEMFKTMADIEKLNAQIATEKEQPAKIREEVKETKAKVTKLTAEEEKIRQEMSPAQVAIMESAKGIAAAGSKWVDAGDRVVLKDPVSGREYATIMKGIEPKHPAEVAGPEIKLRADAATKAAGILMPELEAAYAKMPGGKQKAELRSFIESMKGYMTGELREDVFRAQAAKFPDLLRRFEAASDVYRAGLLAGRPESEIGEWVRSSLKMMAPTPSPAPGVAPGATFTPTPKKETLLEKYAPKPQTKGEMPSDFFFSSALQGKPGGKVYLVRGYEVWWDGEKPIRKELAGTFAKERAAGGKK